MTGKTGHRAPEWYESQLDELSDETEDERRDFTDPHRNPFESQHGPVMGDDGDDNPAYARPKAKFDGDKLDRGDISDPVFVKPTTNPAGQIADAGHGFLVNDARSRPWKTGPRTHCAYCGGEMPKPDVSNYKCEFDPEASRAELALIGEDQPRQTADYLWDALSPRRAIDVRGCKCSGCTLRWLVTRGHERNKGQPKKYCSQGCRKLADSERGRWKRAVASAEKRGQEPPAEPQDRGLKLVRRSGLRSSSEGTGHRYTASTDTGLPSWVPRA